MSGMKYDGIKYDKGKAHQFIKSISNYDLSGEFPKIIEMLKKEEKSCLNKDIDICADYADNERRKIVRFSKVYVEWNPAPWEEHDQAEIWGIRNQMPSEKAALKEQNKRHAAQQLANAQAHLKRLQEEVDNMNKQGIK